METELPKDLREFIVLLNSSDVDYMVAGGYAVAFHGHPRATGDIDIFVDVSEANAIRLAKVLVDFGFAGLGLAASDLGSPDTVIQLGRRPYRIDILTSLSGVTFANARPRAVSARVDGVDVVFLGREDLLVNKAATGRPKDLADLDALSKIGD